MFKASLDNLAKCMSLILIGFMMILFLSCGDCVQSANGIVLDKHKKNTIENVSVYKSSDSLKSKIIRTNNIGHFEYNSISGGFMHCPNVELVFEKKGYKTKKIEFVSISKNDTIYLENN